jgi:hypothetical protein
MITKPGPKENEHGNVENKWKALAGKAFIGNFERTLNENVVNGE